MLSPRAYARTTSTYLWTQSIKFFSTIHARQWTHGQPLGFEIRWGGTVHDKPMVDKTKRDTVAKHSDLPKPRSLPSTTKPRPLTGTLGKEGVSNSLKSPSTAPNFKDLPALPLLHKGEWQSAPSFLATHALGLEQLSRRRSETIYTREKFLQIEEQSRLVAVLRELVRHQQKVNAEVANFQAIYQSLGDTTGLPARERQALHATYNNAVGASQEMDALYDQLLEVYKKLLTETVPPENWETLLFSIRKGLEGRDKDREERKAKQAS